MPDTKYMSARIGTLLVTGLLIFGVAKAATPEGVRLRITSPASGEWAVVGDTVKVSVEFLAGTSNLNLVTVAIQTDTLAADLYNFMAVKSGTARLSHSSPSLADLRLDTGR